MNLSCVDLVEQSHPNESVKDYGKMLRWIGTQRQVDTEINVEEFLTCN